MMKGSIYLTSIKAEGILFLMLFALVMSLGGWIQQTHPLVFGRFLGDLYPLLVLLLSGLMGIACLCYLDRTFEISTLLTPTLKSSTLPVMGAFVFGMIVITIDLLMPMPENLNVAFPVSLLFYPVIGFVAEITFHIVPYALVAVILRGIWARGSNKDLVIQASLLITSFFEPAYQLILMHQSGYYVSLSLSIIGVHIWLISLFQLSLFIRKGFFHIYLFRLVYYMIWHVAWGSFRLLLF